MRSRLKAKRVLSKNVRRRRLCYTNELALRSSASSQSETNEMLMKVLEENFPLSNSSCDVFIPTESLMTSSKRKSL